MNVMQLASPGQQHTASRDISAARSLSRGLVPQVMNAALSNRDVYVLMPTGGGKSRCYQLPALVGGGVTVVITPLVSLLMDQMQHLAEARIPAASFSSSQSLHEQNHIYEDLRSDAPSIRVLFVTPEKVRLHVHLVLLLG